LLKQKAKTDVVDHQGQTLLELAALSGSQEVRNTALPGKLLLIFLSRVIRLLDWWKKLPKARPSKQHS
jgi:ankyrin repeat protein